MTCESPLPFVAVPRPPFGAITQLTYSVDVTLEGLAAKHVGNLLRKGPAVRISRKLCFQLRPASVRQ